MSVYNLLLLIVTGIGALGCFTFVLAYWFRTRGAWMKSEAGRFLMLTNANMGMLFLLVLANQAFGSWPGRPLVTLVVFVTYVAQTWWPLRLLLTQEVPEKSVP